MLVVSPSTHWPKVYEVYVVADAVGGTSVTAYDMALRRIEKGGRQDDQRAALFCELQRDWSRKETVPAFMNLFIKTNGTAGTSIGFEPRPEQPLAAHSDPQGIG